MARQPATRVAEPGRASAWALQGGLARVGFVAWLVCIGASCDGAGEARRHPPDADEGTGHVGGADPATGAPVYFGRYIRADGTAARWEKGQATLPLSSASCRVYVLKGERWREDWAVRRLSLALFYRTVLLDTGLRLGVARSGVWSHGLKGPIHWIEGELPERSAQFEGALQQHLRGGKPASADRGANLDVAEPEPWRYPEHCLAVPIGEDALGEPSASSSAIQALVDRLCGPDCPRTDVGGRLVSATQASEGVRFTFGCGATEVATVYPDRDLDLDILPVRRAVSARVRFEEVEPPYALSGFFPSMFGSTFSWARWRLDCSRFSRCSTRREAPLLLGGPRSQASPPQCELAVDGVTIIPQWRALVTPESRYDPRLDDAVVVVPPVPPGDSGRRDVTVSGLRDRLWYCPFEGQLPFWDVGELRAGQRVCTPFGPPPENLALERSRGPYALAMSADRASLCVWSPWWRLVDEDVWISPTWLDRTWGRPADWYRQDAQFAQHRSDPGFLLFCLLVAVLAVFLLEAPIPSRAAQGVWAKLATPATHRDAPEDRWVFLDLDSFEADVRRRQGAGVLRTPVSRGALEFEERVLVWEPRSSWRLVWRRRVGLRSGRCLAVGSVLYILGSGGEAEAWVRDVAERYEAGRRLGIRFSPRWSLLLSCLAALPCWVAAVGTPVLLDSLNARFGERTLFATTVLLVLFAVVVLARGRRWWRERRHEANAGLVSIDRSSDAS